MTKRDLHRRLNHLAARAQVRPIPMIPTVDAIIWTEDDWDRFEAADPETRERMRVEHAATEAALIADARTGLGVSDHSGEIRVVIVREQIPPDTRDGERDPP